MRRKQLFFNVGRKDREIAIRKRRKRDHGSRRPEVSAQESEREAMTLSLSEGGEI